MNFRTLALCLKFSYKAKKMKSRPQASFSKKECLRNMLLFFWPKTILCVCVCVCVCVRHGYVRACVCLCVCLCDAQE